MYNNNLDPQNVRIRRQLAFFLSHATESVEETKKVFSIKHYLNIMYL